MKTYVKNLFLLPALIAGLSLIPAGRVSGQTFTILHRFDSYDGATPWASLIVSGNTLYGTTVGKGNVGGATVFAVKTDGTDFTNLHRFTASSTNSSGAYTNSGGTDPEGSILSGGTLYGTTLAGGSSGNGTVFAVGTNGAGFTTLHAFTTEPGDGANPIGLLSANNTLYGTTVGGGSSGAGTVFKLNTDDTGFTILHSFTTGASTTNGNFTNSDGVDPAGLILSGNTLYGTAVAGGSSGNGTVFAVNINGTGFTNLHSFSAGSGSAGEYGTNSDGINPWAGLIISGKTLYGTTASGGSSGLGTVFAVNTDGTGFTNLHSFTAGAYDINGNYTNRDGNYPRSGLILSGDTLYGTAAYGGSSGVGTVFALRTDGTSFMNLHDFTGVWGVEGGGYPFAGLVLSGNTLYGTTSDYWNDFQYGTVFSLSLASSLPTVVCSTPLILECADGAAVGTVHAEVEDTNGNPLQVVWTMDSTPLQTNDIPPGGNITLSNLSFTANFGLGVHVVVACASNGQMDAVTCSTTVTVHDTTPPRIRSIVATPNVLWTPNRRMVPVNLKMEAVDNCDSSPMVKITNVTCNEPRNSVAPDWEITGAQTLNLRAVRLGKGPGRIYTIMVECKDTSGNVSIASVDVTVPHN